MLAIKIIATICFVIAAVLLTYGGFQLKDDDKAGRSLMAYLLATEIIAIILTWKTL